MYGREVYHNPWMLQQFDPLSHGVAAPVASRAEVVEEMFPYVEALTRQGWHLHRITRHMLGLYHGQPGGRIWRQILSTDGCKPGAGTEVLQKALMAVEEQATRKLAAA